MWSRLDNTYILIYFIRMDTGTSSKLTLLLRSEAIAKAKHYATQQDISLSALVESFFTQLTTEKKQKRSYSPIVESLAGIIPDSQEPDNAEFIKHLEEKYE